MDPVVEGVGVCVGGKLGVKVAVMTVVSPAASIVVYLYTVCWPGIVGAGKPTGPCCTSGVVDVLVVDCAAMVCLWRNVSILPWEFEWPNLHGSSC